MKIKMNISSVISMSLLMLVLGSAAVTRADHIPVVNVDTIRVPNDYNTIPAAGHEFTYLVDDTGMSGDTRTLADTQDSDCTKYISNGDTWQTGLQFDLGQNYKVGEVRIWNYVDTTTADPCGWSILGMRDVYITFIDEAGTYEYGGWDGTVPQSPGEPGANPASVVLDWSDKPETDVVRYVRFYAEYPDGHPNWNWSGGAFNATGLGQVRFYEKGITDCEQAIELGYTLPADMNRDCYVDIRDLSYIAMEWLDCMDPLDPTCEHLWE